MRTLLLRVWLPDRPGALGQVASQIGSVGGDLVGIDILERGAGTAIDELVVELPKTVAANELIAALLAVDGVAVEDAQPAPNSRIDATIHVLECAHRIVSAPTERRLHALTSEVRNLLSADWAAVVDRTGSTVARVGSVPAAEWLSAFVAGTSHVTTSSEEFAPADLAWADMREYRCTLVVGRTAPVVRHREREELLQLAAIADAVQRPPSAARRASTAA